MRSALLVASACSLLACGDSEPGRPDSAHEPPAGNNQVLRAPISVSNGLEVIISDVIVPPDATVPRHYHPAEEFVYILEGSAIQIEEGRPEKVLEAGDSWVIPPGVIHAPRGGPDGTRAIVFRVHVAGTEERIQAPK